MIRVPCEQGTPEWERARMAIPTASEFDKILTSSRLQRSTSAPKYMARLIACWFMGFPLDFGGDRDDGFIQRGKDEETKARRWYEYQYDLEVKTVGLITRDDGMVGCSPDGEIVLPDGRSRGLELKVPALHTHLGYMVRPESLVEDHHHQVQGGLYVTGWPEWDIVSYHPTLPPVCRRVLPHEKYQAALGPALDAFVTDLVRAREMLAPYRAPQEA